MDTSIIVTTYNWPQALALSLDSIVKQSIQDIQIVIADDGSNDLTLQTVEDILKPSGFKWTHVRHADNSIRQARIKNLAVKFAIGDYLIFIDQDVILHSDFIMDHLALAQEGVFLQGKRAFLPADFTLSLLKTGQFFPPSPLRARLKNRKNALHCPWLGRLFTNRKKFQTTLRGCNFSLSKKDFLEVDGYDETFDGLWGREDSDICYRLFHNRVYAKNLWFAAIQYHLFHKTIKSNATDRLDFELQKNRQEKRIKAIHGFSRLSDEGEVVASS